MKKHRHCPWCGTQPKHTSRTSPYGEYADEELVFGCVNSKCSVQPYIVRRWNSADLNYPKKKVIKKELEDLWNNLKPD